MAAIAFLMAPTIAIRIAPPTAEPPILPAMPPPPLGNKPVALSICSPTPPPIKPTMVLPTGPRLNFFSNAPAMLPPTQPLIRATINCVTTDPIACSFHK